MQRERTYENNRRRTADDGPSSGDNLDRQRTEVEQLLGAADQIFDSINNLHAQQYLEQNRQTGGQ